MKHEYAFDVKLVCALRVQADTLEEAEKIIRETIHCADANLGLWPDGQPILAEVTIDGELSLYERDGESPEAK